MTARSWCFTYTLGEDLSASDQTASQFAEGFWNQQKQQEVTRVRYIIYQLEKGEVGQRYHLQGYVELNSPCRISTVRRLISDTAHWEPRRGTREEARNYCRKEDTRIAGPWEFGAWNAGGQGTRSDLATIANMISTGTLTYMNIREEAPAKYCQYRNGLRDLLAHSAKKRSRNFRHVNVTILVGPPGCGKTRYASTVSNDWFKLDPGSNGTNVWFDGYEGESVLIIDDFYGWIKWTMLLEMLDGYQFRAPIKGSFTYAQWTQVLITSNSWPSTWYNFGNHIEWGALKRRVTRVVMWDHNPEPQEGLLREDLLPWSLDPFEIIEIE